LRIEFEMLDRVRVGEAFELRAVEGLLPGQGRRGGKREREGEGRGEEGRTHGGFRNQIATRLEGKTRSRREYGRLRHASALVGAATAASSCSLPCEGRG